MPSANCSKARSRWAARHWPRLGITAEEIDRVEEAYRLRDCERLERQREAGDYRAGRDQIFAENRALADPEDETGL